MQEQLAMSPGQRLCQNAKFIDFLTKVYNEVIKMQPGNEISFRHLYFIRIYFYNFVIALFVIFTNHCFFIMEKVTHKHCMQILKKKK